MDALWESMEGRAVNVPREAALLKNFEPVAYEAGMLRVRVRTDGGHGGFAAARAEQVAAMASQAAGRPVRVTLQAPAPAVTARLHARVVPTDDAIRSHPLVLSIAELFDASVVRVESHGAAPAASATLDESDDPSTGEMNV
jgi:hypothetical protein